MNNTEVISRLNDLIEMCRDSLEGFKTAAATFPQQRVSELFNIFSRHRARCHTELQAEVHRLGGNTKTSGSVAGELHRSWIDLKAPINRRDRASIIEEWQQREEAAMNSYQEALKVDLPLDVQYVVKRQYMDIKDGYESASRSVPRRKESLIDVARSNPPSDFRPANYSEKSGASHVKAG